MTSSRRAAGSLWRPGLTGAILLAGCATAGPEPSGDAVSRASEIAAYERMLLREYPRELLDAGIGGVTTLELVVDEEGTVQGASVHQSSGHAALDEASRRIAPMVPFTQPVGHDGQPIGGKVTFPVRFDAEEAMAADTCGSGGHRQPADFERYDRRPDYANKREIQRALRREYPPELRDRGVGGIAALHLFIDERGRVRKVRIAETSGSVALDLAAFRVARRARFKPALHCGTAVPVWIRTTMRFTS